MRSIEVAQKSWIALYDKYADGKLERDFFEREEAVWRWYGETGRRTCGTLAGTGRRGKRAGKLWEESRPGYGISGRGYERQTDRKGRCLSG